MNHEAGNSAARPAAGYAAAGAATVGLVRADRAAVGYGAFERAPALLAALLYGLPLLAALGFGLGPAWDAGAWARLGADTQAPVALALSVWTGAASTLLSLAVTLWLVAALHAGSWWPLIERSLGGLLALPHAAFALGLALLLMPSGLLARLLAPWLGWQAPPDVATVQDPLGLALLAGLVLKEVPFLLWCVVAQLHRVGLRAEFERQRVIAASLGYDARSVWWRVLWPQLLPRLALPLLAVWAYGLTVVDMALVLGPTRPPTLAMLAWQWLLDADAAVNAQGAAAALLLAIVMAGGVALAWLGWRLLAPWWAQRSARGDRPAARSVAHAGAASVAALLAAGLYVTAVVLLLFVSVAGVWTFPALWPQAWSSAAWVTVARSAGTLGVTAWLGVLSAATGLLLAVAWLETTPARWDRIAAPLLFVPMLVPGLLLVLGLYRLTLALGLDGSLPGLWLAHSLYTTPYAMVALAPAYRSFDPRYAQTARALGRGPAAFLWRVKWPMLTAPLAAAAAVGFAVSVTQYLSTQFVGAGRHATVTTEALTLASGGQRTLAAAYGLLQALLPALGFALALWLGRRAVLRASGGVA